MGSAAVGLDGFWTMMTEHFYKSNRDKHILPSYVCLVKKLRTSPMVTVETLNMSSFWILVHRLVKAIKGHVLDYSDCLQILMSNLAAMHGLGQYIGDNIIRLAILMPPKTSHGPNSALLP